MKEPKSGRISVITVVKNDARQLEATILSVIAQTATADIDFLVVDGGSTDGTRELIARYADHISWWVSEPDDGIYDAMNKGWAAAAPESYILYLGAGDRIISLPPNLDCYSPHDVVYGSVRMGEQTTFKAGADFRLKLYNTLHHQALLVHKSLHPAPPFDCRYRIYADFDFNQRLMKSGTNFVYSPQFLAYANPGGLSDQRDFSESLRIIKRNYGCLWVFFAIIGFAAVRTLPGMKRLRPLQHR